MSPEQATWVWLGAGAVLAVLELVVPGLILVFLGAGAMLVAGARALGLVEGWLPSFTLWFISSTGFVLGLRGLLRRMFPGNRERAQTDEDTDAFGQLVTVTESVTPNREGRVRFRGTSWKARTTEGTIAAGQRARIVYRENTVWIVEPVPDGAPELLPSSASQPLDPDESP